MEEEKKCVTVFDENNGRRIKLFLFQNQIERAQSDTTYLSQLLNEFYNNEVEEALSIGSGLQVETVNTQTAESDGNGDNSASPSVFIWNEQCIYLMLALYEEHKEEFNTSRHKKIYDKIASEMKLKNPNYLISGGQCQSKMNSLKKMYKKIVDHNATSGNDRATWPYFERMNELFGSTGWAHPVATATEAGPSTATATVSTGQKTTKRKIETLLQDFNNEKKKYRDERLKLQKENYDKLFEQREKHHKEKMALLELLLNK